MVLEVINQKKKINNICLFYTLLYGFIQLLTYPCFLPINMGLKNNKMSRNNTSRLIEPIATKRSADTIIGCNLSQEGLVSNKQKLRRECDSIYNVAGYASNAASFAVNAGNFQLAVGGMSHCAACYCTCCNIRA